jgi:diguanylate cyclase (GGDEF)-like protein/PAS domain S-box-containing protein
LNSPGGARTGRKARDTHRRNPAVSPAVAGAQGSARFTAGEEGFRSAYAAAGVALARLTRQGRIIDVNQAFGRLLGRPAADLAGCRLLDLVHPDDADAVRAGRLTSLKSGRVQAELRFNTGDSEVLGRATISIARRADDVPDSLILTVEDLTALKSGEAALERAMLRDPATGLANSALLASRLTHSIATARRAGRKLAVLALEIDRFAAIDELQGTGSAQKLLAYMAARLQERVRPSDSVARTGGNELAVVLGKVDEADLAAGVGRRLLATLEPEFHLGEAGFQVKISMGVAVFPGDGKTAEALLRRARMDMYVGQRLQPGVGSGGAGAGAGGLLDDAAGQGHLVGRHGDRHPGVPDHHPDAVHLFDHRRHRRGLRGVRPDQGGPEQVRRDPPAALGRRRALRRLLRDQPGHRPLHLTPTGRDSARND